MVDRQNGIARWSACCLEPPHVQTTRPVFKALLDRLLELQRPNRTCGSEDRKETTDGLKQLGLATHKTEETVKYSERS